MNENRGALFPPSIGYCIFEAIAISGYAIFVAISFFFAPHFYEQLKNSKNHFLFKKKIFLPINKLVL
jgi:hypothetical protein